MYQNKTSIFSGMLYYKYLMISCNGYVGHILDVILVHLGLILNIFGLRSVLWTSIVLVLIRFFILNVSFESIFVTIF